MRMAQEKIGRRKENEANDVIVHNFKNIFNLEAKNQPISGKVV